MKRMRYRVAVIGLGQVGYRFDLDPKRRAIWTHCGAWQKQPRAVLIAVADSDPAAVAAVTKRLAGVRGYTDYRELLRSERPDIVSVCTPDAAHAAVVRSAAGCGVRAIWCEKPLAATVREARALVALCRRRHIVLAVNHNRRWDPVYAEVRRAIAGGAYGTLRTIIGCYNARIYRAGTHLIDVLRLLGGPIIAVTAFGTAGNHGEPSPHGLLQFQRGGEAVLLATGNPAYNDFTVEIMLTRGRIRILGNGAQVEYARYRPAAMVSNYFDLTTVRARQVTKPVSTFTRAAADLICCLERGGEPACTGADGTAAVAVAAALVQSLAAGGRKVRVHG